MAEHSAAERQRPSDEERGEAGFSLPELLIAMTIFGGLMAIVMVIVIQVSFQSADNMARSQQVSEVRIGLSQIDRQVRSGNVISDPAGETVANSGVAAGNSLRVFTQTNGVRRCVQWRVIFPDPPSQQGELQFRSWDPDWQSGGSVEAWSVVANDVVAPAAGDSVFRKVDPLSGTSAQSVRVTLRVQGEQSSSKPTTVTSVLTGRNTVYGYPSDVCSPVPTP